MDGRSLPLSSRTPTSRAAESDRQRSRSKPGQPRHPAVARSMIDACASGWCWVLAGSRVRRGSRASSRPWRTRSVGTLGRPTSSWARRPGRPGPPSCVLASRPPTTSPDPRRAAVGGGRRSPSTGCPGSPAVGALPGAAATGGPRSAAADSAAAQAPPSGRGGRSLAAGRTRPVDLGAARLGGLFHGWPVLPMWISAVSLDSGRRTVFGRDREASVADAVAASCASPATSPR